MELIDKSALMTEIEKIVADETESIKSFEHSKNASEVQRGNARIGVLTYLRFFLNTLKVKDVDLEKEIDDAEKRFGDIDEMGGYRILIFADEFRNVLRHFFELGLKVNQAADEVKIGETQIYLDDDGGEPPYDGKQWLDFSCMEYEIPKDKFNDGDNVEIFIRKTQKGE